MQTTKEQLVRQQMIMKHLGFYNGRIDGVWSRTSIKAKREWEYNKLFKPAYPNRGLPLDPFKKMPSGVMIDPKNRQLLTHIGLTAERIAELTGEKLVPLDDLKVKRDPESVESKREQLSEDISETAMPRRVPDHQDRKSHGKQNKQKQKHT